ncbi:tellurite resistance TerB family protein [Synechococcus sp. CS-1329]|uniref:tellurite resistance TerB family protein n=1 Tax=Synechococcus sp. CS-1329 TaxID=2847975 RepID=UPI00223BBFEF|nr:tellurite resistance TerB family protein [Synechococcus sp. CS-1329]MCT0217502.1 tellurite resistance TerB family protein [Synechococcus sp. CS-1329]
MDSPTAFVAVALAAVSWDGVLTRAGSRALRHSLDYRVPFNQLGDAAMIQLFDRLLADLRRDGAPILMARAALQLDPHERRTAYAVAAEIMRSDGPLVAQEQQILTDLAAQLDLDPSDSVRILEVMEILHAELVCSPVAA